MESRQLTGALISNDTEAPMLLGISGGFLFLSILLLSARLWSRLRPISNLKADDWTVLGGTILAVVNFSIQCTACAHGLGRRTEFVSRSNRSTVLRLLFIMQVIWYWSITLVKLSVALLLLRLKPGRRWKIFLYSTMAVLLFTAIFQTCFQFLQCRPFSVYWDPSVFFKNGGVKCFPRTVINGNIIANSTIHVITDLVFSFVPITFIRKLHRPRNEKIFLSILMGLGLFASTFAILRTVGLATYFSEQDFFRMNVMPTLYATLEQEVALVAATIPTLKNFMQRALVSIGHYFYEKESESQIRGRLVGMGFLATCDGDGEGARTERKPSKPDIGFASFGSPTVGKRIDEFCDTVVEEREIVMVALSKAKTDGGLERGGR